MTILNSVRGRQLASALAETGIVSFGDKPMELNRGSPSRFYVKTRECLTEHPMLLRQLGELIAQRARREFGIDRHRPIGFIPSPNAGIPLAVAAGMCQKFGPTFSVMMYKQPTKRRDLATGQPIPCWTEGTLDQERNTYVLADNALMSASAGLEAAWRLEKDGYDPTRIPQIYLVDRDEGGANLLRYYEYPVAALFKLPALVSALVARGIWPTERLDIYESERRQFTIVEDITAFECIEKPCTLCGDTAMGRYFVPNGIVCAENQRMVDLCLQHVLKNEPLGPRILICIFVRQMYDWYVDFRDKQHRCTQ